MSCGLILPGPCQPVPVASDHDDTQPMCDMATASVTFDLTMPVDGDDLVEPEQEDGDDPAAGAKVGASMSIFMLV